MAFKFLQSSNANCDGGIATTTEIDGKTILPVIEAYKTETVEPNTVTGGVLYRKFFIKNNNIQTVNNCKIFIGQASPDFDTKIAPGTDIDATPPADASFIVADKPETGIFVGPMSTGEHTAFWIRFEWDQNTGVWDPVPINIGIVGDIDASAVTVYMKLRIFKADYVRGDEDNDYTSFVKDVFIVFLQNAFYRFYRKDVRWNPILKYSKLAISDRYVFNPDDPEFRPQLVVARRAISWGDITRDQMEKYNMMSGATNKMDMLYGSIDIECVSKEDLHAEFLANTVFKLTRFFRDEIKEMGLFNILRTTVGEPFIAVKDSRHEAVVVPVSVSFAFQDSWLYEDLNYLKLSGIEFTFNQTRSNCIKK